MSSLEKECASLIRDAVEKNWNWNCSPFGRPSASEIATELDEEVEDDFEFLQKFGETEEKSDRKTLVSHE